MPTEVLLSAVAGTYLDGARDDAPVPMKYVTGIAGCYACKIVFRWAMANPHKVLCASPIIDAMLDRICFEDGNYLRTVYTPSEQYEQLTVALTRRLIFALSEVGGAYLYRGRYLFTTHVHSEASNGSSFTVYTLSEYLARKFVPVEVG